jgi:hypothetical protein
MMLDRDPQTMLDGRQRIMIDPDGDALPAGAVPRRAGYVPVP